jgi:hypothetical protein
LPGRRPIRWRKLPSAALRPVRQHREAVLEAVLVAREAAVLQAVQLAAVLRVAVVPAVVLPVGVLQVVERLARKPQQAVPVVGRLAAVVERVEAVAAAERRRSGL